MRMQDFFAAASCEIKGNIITEGKVVVIKDHYGLTDEGIQLFDALGISKELTPKERLLVFKARITYLSFGIKDAHEERKFLQVLNELGHNSVFRTSEYEVLVAGFGGADIMEFCAHSEFFIGRLSQYITAAHLHPMFYCSKNDPLYNTKLSLLETITTLLANERGKVSKDERASFNQLLPMSIAGAALLGCNAHDFRKVMSKRSIDSGAEPDVRLIATLVLNAINKEESEWKQK